MLSVSPFITGHQNKHHGVFLMMMMVLVVFLHAVDSLPHSPQFSNTPPQQPIQEGGSSSTTSGGDPLAQFHNLLREALKYMHNLNRGGGTSSSAPNSVFNTRRGSSADAVGGGQQADYSSSSGRISGQVNVRNPRSEVGDVTLKLYHLQEMDRKYGAKTRPRFGKRSEVTQDNFIPMYGDEERVGNSNNQQQEQTVLVPYGAIGDVLQQQPPPVSLLYIP